MEALDPEPVFVTKYETTLDAKMDGFEKILGKQKYMAGDVSLPLPLPQYFCYYPLKVSTNQTPLEPDLRRFLLLLLWSDARPDGLRLSHEREQVS
jgi:hypothetical protein